MATRNAAAVPTANRPVKPIDGWSGPRHDLMCSNASTAVNTGVAEGQGQQKENHSQNPDPGSYFPQFANISQVVGQNQIRAPISRERKEYLDKARSHLKRLTDTMQLKLAQKLVQVLETIAGSPSHAPSIMSDNSLVHTPPRFYGNNTEEGNHLGDTAQASSCNIPRQMEQGVSPPGENPVDEEDQSPAQLGTSQSPMQLSTSQSATHLGTLYTPTQLGAPESQLPTQLGTPEITLKQIRSEGRFNKLWYKIHVFVYDLKVCRNRPNNQGPGNRVLALQERGSPVGAPYFDDHEIQTLLSFKFRKSFFTSEKLPLWNLLRLRFDLDCSVRASQGGRNPPPDVTFKSRDSFLDKSKDLGWYLQRLLKVKEKNLRNKIFLATMNDVGLDIEHGQTWL